ncbi:MAG: hypothetical protein JSS30_06055 [Verrucomicrobia bacterium]|nr:hypothetical protein [Verrucomicrobiota bacterium]
MLACWLAISPFIFAYPGDATFFWVNDFITCTVIAFFSLISFYKPLKKMHLCNLVVGLYLIALAYVLKGDPMESTLQNYMALGILFFMIGIIPTDATSPPQPWRDFYEQN